MLLGAERRICGEDQEMRSSQDSHFDCSEQTRYDFEIRFAKKRPRHAGQRQP